MALDQAGARDHPMPNGGYAHHFVCEAPGCRRERMVVYAYDDAELCPVEDWHSVCDLCGGSLTQIPRAEHEARGGLGALGVDPPPLGEARALWERARKG